MKSSANTRVCRFRRESTIWLRLDYIEASRESCSTQGLRSNSPAIIPRLTAATSYAGIVSFPLSLFFFFFFLTSSVRCFLRARVKFSMYVYIWKPRYVCTRAPGVTGRNWIFQKSGTHLGKVDYRLRAAWWCYRKSSFDGGKWGINGVAEICEYVYRIFARWVFRIYSSIKRFSSWGSTTRFSIFRLSVCSEKFQGYLYSFTNEIYIG